MHVIQLIKIFDQTDIKQRDPADDEEDQFCVRKMDQFFE
jgi:hypothetical protein